MTSRPLCKFLILFFSSLAWANPAPSEHEKGPAPVVFAITEAGSEIKIPSAILPAIEAGGTNPSGTFSFFPVKVRLREKNSGVLKAPEILLEFPKGGGEVDLASYLGKVPGTFFIFFELDREKEDLLKVFYVSKARKRRLNDGIWGLGCKKYLDLTGFYNREIFKHGIKVNTTRNRHASVVGGHFIFSSSNSKRLILTQVSFKDSKAPELFCDAPGAD